MADIDAHGREDGDIFTGIGGTPLVTLTRVSRPDGMRLLAKLEGGNPTGSIKDRIVYHMLARARAEGRLQPGQPVVEASTGNTGIALAMIARRYGHAVEVVLPHNAYPPVARLLRLHGAEVLWTPAERGVAGAIDVARARAAATRAYFLDQFHDAVNVQTHYESTGPEILRQAPDIDVLVAGVGTGGTVSGAGRFLKERRPGVAVVAAEAHPASQVQGLASFADGFSPPLLDFSVLDAKFLVRNADAFRAARELVGTEGIFGGVSAGAVLHVARVYAERRLAATPGRRLTVVCLFADAGWKYLDSRFWLPEEEQMPKLDHVEDPEAVVWW